MKTENIGQLVFKYVHETRKMVQNRAKISSEIFGKWDNMELF